MDSLELLISTAPVLELQICYHIQDSRTHLKHWGLEKWLCHCEFSYREPGLLDFQCSLIWWLTTIHTPVAGDPLLNSMGMKVGYIILIHTK